MMHVGTVNENGDPRLEVRLRGPHGGVLDVSVIVDSGFSGAIVLGMAQIAQLGLELRDQGVFTLADGTDRKVNTYVGEIEWFGKWRRFNVVALEGGPLVGMLLLMGRRLTIDAVEDGLVRIESIPNSK